VTIRAFATQRHEYVRLQVAPVDEGQGVVGDVRPEARGIGSLVGGVGPELRRDKEVRAHGHQRDKSQLWIARRATVRHLAAEVAAILVRVRHAQRRPVDRVERQLAPGLAARTLMSPFRRRAEKQPLHRRRAEATPSLRDRARRRRSALSVGQRDLELSRQLGDVAVAEDRHRDHEPDHLLHRQPSPSQRRDARRRQRLFYPATVELSEHARVLLGSEGCGDKERFGEAAHTATLILLGPSEKTLSESGAASTTYA
jgi:hypothetical protein